MTIDSASAPSTHWFTFGFDCYQSSSLHVALVKSVAHLLLVCLSYASSNQLQFLATFLKQYFLWRPLENGASHGFGFPRCIHWIDHLRYFLHSDHFRFSSACASSYVSFKPIHYLLPLHKQHPRPRSHSWSPCNFWMGLPHLMKTYFLTFPYLFACSATILYSSDRSWLCFQLTFCRYFLLCSIQNVCSGLPSYFATILSMTSFVDFFMLATKTRVTNWKPSLASSCFLRRRVCEDSWSQWCALRLS